MTTKTKKTYNLSKQSIDKLFQLRNYHNKTYDSLIEIMIENAFLSMNEAINLHKGKELEEQNLKVGFQVQQLTLMFSELKKELAEVRTENQILKETKEKLFEEFEELRKTNEKQYTDNQLIYQACGNSFKNVKRNYEEIYEWINKKDSKFTSKLGDLFVIKKEDKKE